MKQLLEIPSRKRRDEFLKAVRLSRKLHRGWAAPPADEAAFDKYLKALRKPGHLGYWVIAENGELAGVFNINEIVRGRFCSGYLGYYAFAPHNQRGHMTGGLRAVLFEAFRREGFHRLEANIQPENEASRRLVQRVGFRLEGYSPRYLKIAGRWRDHERWAITVEDWRSK